MAKLTYKRMNSSGVMMIIVVVFILIMSIVSANMISQSMSEAKVARSQAVEVMKEELFSGAWWGLYNKKAQLDSLGNPINYPLTYSYSTTFHNRTYNVLAVLCNPGVPPNASGRQKYDEAANGGVGGCVNATAAEANVWIRVTQP